MGKAERRAAEACGEDGVGWQESWSCAPRERARGADEFEEGALASLLGFQRRDGFSSVWALC